VSGLDEIAPGISALRHDRQKPTRPGFIIIKNQQFIVESCIADAILQIIKLLVQRIIKEDSVKFFTGTNQPMQQTP